MTGPRMAAELPPTDKEGNIDLAGDWNMRAMSFEDSVAMTRKNLKYVYILIGTFPIALVVILLLMVVLGGEDLFLVLAGSVPLVLFLIIFTSVVAFMAVRRVKDPNVNREVKAGWEKVGRDRAIGALKEYADSRGIAYRTEEYRGYRGMGWKEPEVRFLFDDGIILKGMYQIINRQAAGWVAIEYPGRIWERAFYVQADLDRFLDKKNIIYRNMRGKRKLFRSTRR